LIVTKNVNFGKLYSEEFKRHVLLEIERLGLSANGARLRYGIGGKMTVYKWLSNRKEILGDYAREELEMESEKGKGDDFSMMSKSSLEVRVRELEIKYEEAEQRRVAYEKMIEIAELELKISIRKKSGAKQSKS
jgi:hypothetical protein